MGKLIKEWVKGILTEGIEKKVVVYAGRFQPFHKGHYLTYDHLVKQFGRDNVYIGTSNKTDNIKSPFKFKEKKMVMIKMFGVPASKIVQIKNPYAPKEIIGKFDKDKTAFVTVVGEKDRYRLKGKYFEPYHPDKIEKGYEEKGYVYVAPAQGEGISGTEVRKSLSSGDDEIRKAGFKRAYGKFDPKIYKFLTNRLGKIEITMERFLSTFDFNKLISESSSTKVGIGGNSQGVDDGPGFSYGNSKSYKAVGDETARRLGWMVVDYILDTDEDSIYADDARSIDDKYPVSYFPSGIDGLDAASQRYIDLRGTKAYKSWVDKIKGVATSVGYKLIDFLGAEESIDDTKDAPVKAPSPKQRLKDGDDEQTQIHEGLITEGGAYGHMAHPFDTQMNLTFGDLKTIISNALNGKLEFAREKTDGQALAISWRDDKGLIAARNGGHLKNSGENALDISGVASKFQGRGGLTDAYNFAMEDLSKAIKSLSKAQRDKIFNQGSSFMNIEVIFPTSVNVIPYGQPLLVFHGTMQYNMDGKAIGADTSAAKILAGMIKQINQDVQKNYTIQGPPVVKLPQSEELSKKQGKYYSELNKIQKEFKLKDSNGVADYHQAWWEQYVDKNSPSTLDNKTKMGLVKRWAFFDNSFRLNKKNISDSKVLAWATKTDKQDKAKISKQNLRKFEDIFLGVGADVLSFMSSALTVNPDEALRTMKSELDKTVKAVQKSGDVKKIEKLRMELERLAAVGGKDKIVPNEGIVFTYKGGTYKLTGTFASLNQILGLMYF
jgi:nicotinamide mononucleotide adenylyltransferase